jgi:hypothetical protein
MTLAAAEVDKAKRSENVSFILITTVGEELVA